MKTLIAMLVCLGCGVAHADVFAFKDLAGYEKCMSLDHLVETVTTDTGAQTRFLSHEEVQARCIESAVKLLSGTKTTDLMLEFVKTTRRLAAPQAALELADVLVNATLAGCNDIVVYEVLLAGLSSSTDDRVFLPTARRIAKRCLRDATFKQDFVEEKANSDARIAANACQILAEEKLVKSCKGSK
jgi:hypothetical protein